MATKANSNGLLSKMAKFVLNLTTKWSDLNKPGAEQESGYSKHALKEIIQRKRQNDAVRRREFDYLRKLRRCGPSTRPGVPSRPSFFHTSILSNQDERAMTLRKIDEIEAQMSKQWWKVRQEPPGGHLVTASPAPPPPASQANPTGDARTSFSPTFASEMSPGWDSLHTLDYASTQMGEPPPRGVSTPASKPTLMAFHRPAAQLLHAGSTDLSTSNLLSVDPAAVQTDPDMDEAAIRFANGDDAGAEAALLTALEASDASPESADRWAAALFDLYRSTGQQSSFDSVAIDYAIRFGRSAPAWFSLPYLLGRVPAVSAPQAFALMDADRAIVWACPVVLDALAMQGLLDSAVSPSEPLHLHWSQLQSITPDAGRLLADLFTRWCSEPVRLHLGGAEVLDRTLRLLTPAGDTSVDPLWWRLRLETLRILRLQDEFELVALDYCVTFEVSPPPWQDARCELVQRSSGAASVSELSPPSGSADRQLDADFSQAILVHSGVESVPASLVELKGEILGDAAQALDKLQEGLKGADRLVISCSRLIRVDFSAAGSILNWVVARESEGCSVQFRDVPRLVAAFFNVIGINEHARVVVRST